jgi:hypothetical protein
MTTYGIDATGAVITALGNATGGVISVVTVNQMYQPTGIMITVSPSANLIFDTTTDVASIADALTTKLAGGSITYDYGGPFQAGTVTSVVTDGNLILTVPLQ